MNPSRTTLFVMLLTVIVLLAGACVVQPGTTGILTRITAESHNQLSPAMYGDNIVYVDDRNGNFDIYLYDLASREETRITTDPGNQNYPQIFGNTIVYQDDRNGNLDVYYYDLASQTETRITSDSHDQQNPEAQPGGGRL
jgi:beta propeller repeat protein